MNKRKRTILFFLQYVEMDISIIIRGLDFRIKICSYEADHSIVH